MGRRIISRSEAIRLKLKLYFTGKPCCRGHRSARLTCSSQCRKCNLIRCRARWKRGKRKILAQMRRHYRRNRERIIARVAVYTARNAKAVSHYQRRYRKRNRARQRLLARRHYELNRALYILRAKAWSWAHPECKRTQVVRRRMRLRKTLGSFSLADVERLFEKQRGTCAGCSSKLTRFEVDHRTPLSRGGSNYPRNLQLLCRRCNRSKHTLTMTEWLRRERKRPTNSSISIVS